MLKVCGAFLTALNQTGRIQKFSGPKLSGWDFWLAQRTTTTLLPITISGKEKWRPNSGRGNQKVCLNPCCRRIFWAN